jgi:hypothetical protein
LKVALNTINQTKPMSGTITTTSSWNEQSL